MKTKIILLILSLYITGVQAIAIANCSQMDKDCILNEAISEAARQSTFKELHVWEKRKKNDLNNSIASLCNSIYHCIGFEFDPRNDSCDHHEAIVEVANVKRNIVASKLNSDQIQNLKCIMFDEMPKPQSSFDLWLNIYLNRVVTSPNGWSSISSNFQ